MFGKILEGMDIVREIEEGETGAGDRPKKDVVIVDSGGYFCYFIKFVQWFALEIPVAEPFKVAREGAKEWDGRHQLTSIRIPCSCINAKMKFLSLVIYQSIIHGFIVINLNFLCLFKGPISLFNTVKGNGFIFLCFILNS